MKLFRLASFQIILSHLFFVLALAQTQHDIIYLEQPADIDLGAYVSTWPQMNNCILKLKSKDTVGALNLINDLENKSICVDGALNLLAQIERHKGNLDKAMELVERAIELEPNQHLHYFQQALISFKYREQSSFPISQWKWHNRTKDAYEKALTLEPKLFFYRYYLAYSYINTPSLFGGDKDKALEISQEGIRLGIVQCYLIRADVYRAMDRFDLAFADYDTSIALRLFKTNLTSFVGAGYAAMEKKDWSRAKKYFDYLTQCKPEEPNPYDCLGDYYLAMGDKVNAEKAYKTALQKNSNFTASAKKLERLQKDDE